MVVFIDLEDENEPPEHIKLRSAAAMAGRWSPLDSKSTNNNIKLGSSSALHALERDNAVGVASLMLSLANGKDAKGEIRHNPNKNSLTEALGCYPYVYRPQYIAN